MKSKIPEGFTRQLGGKLGDEFDVKGCSHKRLSREAAIHFLLASCILHGMRVQTSSPQLVEQRSATVWRV